MYESWELTHCQDFNIIYQIYKDQMYDQIKQEAIRIGTEIDKQSQLCREWQNMPKQFVAYRKTQPSIAIANGKVNDGMSLKKEQDDRYKRLKEEISNDFMKRINQLISQRRDDRSIAFKQQLQMVKIENNQLRGHIDALLKEIASKQDVIERITTEYHDRLEKQEISKAILENSEEQMTQKMQLLQDKNKQLIQTSNDLSGKIEKYEEITKKLGEQLRIRRQEGNQVNKFNQRLEEELQRKAKEIQKLNIEVQKLNIVIQENEQQNRIALERQAKKGANLGNAITALKGELQRMIETNKAKDVVIKELEEVVYSLNYEKEEKLKLEESKMEKEKQMERVNAQKIEKLNAAIEQITFKRKGQETKITELMQLHQQEARKLKEEIKTSEAKYIEMFKLAMMRQQSLQEEIQSSNSKAEELQRQLQERQLKDQQNKLNKREAQIQTEHPLSFIESEVQTEEPDDKIQKQAQTQQSAQCQQSTTQTEQLTTIESEAQTEAFAQSLPNETQTQSAPNQSNQTETDTIQPKLQLPNETQTQYIECPCKQTQTQQPRLNFQPFTQLTILPQVKQSASRPIHLQISNPFYLSIPPQQQLPSILSITHQLQHTIFQQPNSAPQFYIAPDSQSFQYLAIPSTISSNPSLMLPNQLSSYRLNSANNLNSLPSNPSEMDLESLNRARIIDTQSQANEVDCISSIKVLEDEPHANFIKKAEIQTSQTQLKQLINHYNVLQEESISRQSFLLTLKASYLRIESQYLMLLSQSALKQEQIYLLLTKNADQQREIASLKGDFSNYSNLISQLNKRIQQLQKYSYSSPKLTGEGHDLQDRLANLHNLIDLINHNCLKNNCDSPGIINIKLNKFPQKNMDYINLSPTDLQKFNKKEDCIEALKQPLILQFQNAKLCHYKSEQSLDCLEKESKDKGGDQCLDEIGRKKSVESQNYASKHLANKLVKLSQEVQNQRECQTEHHQVPVAGKAPPSPNSKQHEKQSHVDERSISIQNNPDNEITLTYQQLKEKYRNLYLQNQKMAEYLRALHIINLKWKKSTAEIEHHSKVNVLAKLADRVSNLLYHREKALSMDSHEFLAELTSLIKDIQSYIHFLDHLIKIEPFQDHYRSPYHFKRLGKKIILDTKSDKQIIAKKTYSEGCSREEDFIENFDIYPYETDQIPHNEEQRKEKEKEFQEFDKFYPQENKELFSEISSVKNQSQWSQISSFIHSKTELEQLGHYLKNNKNIDEIDEQYALKRDYTDQSKVEPKSFNELRHLYIKIRDENDELLKERANYQRIYKREIERLEGQHTKKMNKITKEFNDSFGLLCQRSGLHHVKEKTAKKVINHKEIQVEAADFQLRKRSHSKTEFDAPKMQQLFDLASQELHDKIREKEEKNREQLMQLERNKATISQLNKKLNQRQEQVDKLTRSIAQNSKKDQRMLGKISEDLTQFIKKVIAKAAVEKSSLSVDRSKSFRKNSTAINPNQYIPATKISQLRINAEQMFIIVREELKAGKEEWNDNFTIKQVGTMVSRWIGAFRRQVHRQFLQKIKEKLESLLGVELEDWCQQFQEYRLSLEDYFSQDQLVNQIFNKINELILKLRGADDINQSCGSLSINSKVVEEEVPRLQSQEDNKFIRVESKQSEEDLRRELQELKLQSQSIKSQHQQLSTLHRSQEETIHQLREQIKLKTQELLLTKYSPLEVVIRQKQKQIISMQQQILALRDQATKLKHKSKRPKVYHIQN